MYFQEIILTLQRYWADKGCLIGQPTSEEVGAGTFNPLTFFGVLREGEWKVAYVEPSRRPTDGRYGENPNRLFQHYQFQVVIKPSPPDIQQVYLRSLSALGIEIENGAILTDRRMKTSVEGIYAAGDVTGHYLLAHVATREGIVSAENATGSEIEIDYSAVPVTIYTFPEISRVGISEDEANSRGIEVKTGRFPFAANGKAKGLGETEGFVKWIARKQDNRILGLHVIGPHATELVSSGVVAIQNGLTIDDFVSSIFPHPTLSESVHESAEAVLGEAIHLK